MIPKSIITTYKKGLAILIVMVLGVVDAQTISINSISANSFCAGDAIDVSYSKTGSFTSGNVFSLELSDDGGSFSSPVVIGTHTSTVQGTINGTIPTSTTNGSQYRVRVVSTTPAVSSADNGSGLIINGADFLESEFGNNQWNVLAYAGNNFDTLRGSYVIPTLNFDTRNQWDELSTPSDASGYVGCAVPLEQHSLRLKRRGFPCGEYQIDVPDHDDYAYLYVDGVEVWSFIGCCQSHSNVWSGPLDENSTVEFRFREFTGRSHGALSFTATSGGGNIADNYNCTNGEHTLSISEVSGAVWSPSTGLNTTTGNTVVATPTAKTTYTVTGTNDCNGQPFSASIDVQPSHLSTSETLFGDGYWHAVSYASRVFNNYQGYFEEADLSFNTNTIYSGNTPSSAQGYIGCAIPTTNHSVSFNRTNFACGEYQIDVNNHDDEMSIYVDGVQVFAQNGFGNTIVDAWSGFLGPDSEVSIRYANGGGPGQLIISMTQLNTNSSSSITSQYDCTTGNTTLTAKNLTNVTWSPSTGLSSTNTVQTISNHNEKITYTVTGASVCNGQPLSESIDVQPSHLSTSETLFGDGYWHAVSYASRTFSNYQGYFEEADLSFNTNTIYSANTPSSAQGYIGCAIPTTNHSVSFNRTNFACGEYQIDVNNHDDEMSIYVDGVQVFVQNGFGNTIVDAWSGFLGPDSEVSIRYANGGGPGQLIISMTQLNTNISHSIVSQFDCPTGNTTLTANNLENVTWSPSTGLSSTNTVQTIANYHEAITYTVTGTSVCDGSPVSASIDVRASAVGSDPAIFGDNKWSVYAFDNSNFTDYRGFYETEGYTNDTRDLWPISGSPSDYSEYRGCVVGDDTHGITHKRKGFPCGQYVIDIDNHDDGASLWIDGVQVWSNSGHNITHPAVWTGELNTESTVEFRHQDGVGSSYGAFTLKSSVLDTTSWNGGASAWNTPSNWSNGLPTNNKTTRINNAGASPTITADVEIANLILGNNANINIGTSNNLTIGGSIYVPSGNSDILGHLIMKEGGCSIHVIDATNPLDVSVLEIDHATSVENIGAMINVTDRLLFTKGNIKTNNNLTLVSTQSKTAYLDKVEAGTITDNLTIQRWVGASLRKWWHLSAPVSNATAQDWQQEFPITGEFTGADSLDGNNNVSVKWYDETNPASNFNEGWSPYPVATNTEQIIPGRGYRVYLRENRSTPLLDTTIDLSGTPNMGSLTYPISYTVGDDALSAGWNFIGNPYPSAIDWDAAGWSKSNMQNAVYVWDALTSRYTTYVDGVGTNGGSNQIASGQSFWVRADNASASLQITEDCKISNQVALHRQASKVVYVNIQNGNEKSNTALRFVEGAAVTFEKEIDAYYFGGSYPVNIGSYNDNWEYFSVNSLPTEGEFDIPLYVYHKNIKNTTFTLSFEGIDQLENGDYLTLTDVYKGITTEIISDNFTYDFEYDGNEESKGGSRFVLRKKVSSITNTGEKISTTNGVSVYPNKITTNESFSVLLNGEQLGGELAVVDMQGKIVKSVAFDSSMDVQNIRPNLSVGFYTVVITIGNGVTTAKLVVE